jgi:class 3 adenylate cyclase/GAF domain-containing protein
MTINPSSKSAGGITDGQGVPLPDALHSLNDLRGLLDTVTTGLRSQDALLRIRQLSLPQTILNELVQVEHDLAFLSEALIADETELTQLRALAEMSALINSTLEVDAVLGQAMDMILMLTSAERGFILLTNEETGELEYRVARGVETLDHAGGDLVAHQGGYEVSRTILNEVITNATALLSDNAAIDPLLQQSDTIAKFVLRSVMCVPLVYKDIITGAVYVDNRYREGVFTERELNLLTAFANQTAIAIENALLYARVQQQLGEITQVNDLLENIFGSITSGVITTDASDNVTLYNAAAADILRVAREDAIGGAIHDVLPTLDAAILRDARDHNQRAALDLETEIQGRGQAYLSLKLTPLQNARQETQGAALVVDDLTGQRAREKALQTMRIFVPPGMVEKIDQIANLALGGERREITCAFIYVCSYSVLPRGVRPQDQMMALNEYLEVATEAIFRSDGVIDKYMGNEIMVLFNSQLNPQADHALRAVEMTQQLRTDFMALYRRLGLPPDTEYYRIGVHSGVVTLGNVGTTSRRSFTAIGDAVNLAKRLQENANDGQIIISEDTLRHIEAATGGDVARLEAKGMRFEERAAIQVKGRQQYTRIYEVVGS